MNKTLIITLLGVVIFVIVFGLVFGLSFIRTYNHLVTLNEAVDTSWAQVENQLQRRFDLIPNLVETVKRYVQEEETIFTQIAEARSRIGTARTPSQRMEAEGELGGFLSRLLMITENYPQLRASEQFQTLQAQLEGTENRIAVERKRYNDTVQTYNVGIKQFPTRIYAALAGFQPRDFFAAVAEAQTAPRVNFGDTSPATATPATP